jgi:hypothetical protein
MWPAGLQLDQTVLSSDVNIINEWQFGKMWREVVMAYLSYYSRIFLKTQGKTTKIVGIARYSNPEPTKHETGRDVR